MEALIVLALHSLLLETAKDSKLGNREPQNQMAEGDDAFHHKVSVRCYAFHILAYTKAKYSKKDYYEVKLRISPPNPSGWQTGRTFRTFYCFTSINVAKLDVTSSVTVFSITLSNLQIKVSRQSHLTKEIYKSSEALTVVYSIHSS